MRTGIAIASCTALAVCGTAFLMPGSDFDVRAARLLTQDSLSSGDALLVGELPVLVQPR